MQAPGDRGFTLIELTIGLGIMLLVSSLALPRLVDVTEEYRLTAVAREVAGNVANARIRAIVENADYRVIVSDSTTYLLQEEVAGSWTDRASYEMPPNFTIGSSGSVVEFHRWGNATPVATLDITNKNSTVAQVVTATSGRSYVQ
jgi:prepilin-type N-terminal cleavage/methylation domain-containing protein